MGFPSRRSRRLWLVGVGVAVVAGGFPPAMVSADSAGEVLRVEAVAETEPAVASGDSIDDPAIWVDPSATTPPNPVIAVATHH